MSKVMNPNTFRYRRPHIDNEDIATAIEEIQERVCNMSEPENGTTYEWVNERIEEEVLKLTIEFEKWIDIAEENITQLENRIKELENV